MHAVPFVEATSHTGRLYRLGYLPDPLIHTPWEYVGNGRFDDPHCKAPAEPPLGRFRTLYSGRPRLGCFVEALAKFRPDPTFLAQMQALDASDDTVDTLADIGRIPADWREARAVSHFTLPTDTRWLDLRAAATIQELRKEFANLISRLGLLDLDISSVRGPRRELSQAIARRGYEDRFDGLIYRSRFSDEYDLWAIFEHRCVPEPIGSPQPIESDDPDFRDAAALLGLTIA